MPEVELYGAQPPIELLRQLIGRRGLYDRQKLIWKSVEDTTMICAAAPPGGGRNELTQRFTSKFNIICAPQTPKTVLSKIFNSILQEFFKASGFNEQITHYADDIVSGTIEVYQKISEEMKPTPAKFHYTFNLRDVSKVVQGILMTKPISVQTGETLARLWIHECSRVFHDRLINPPDREVFTRLLTEMVLKNFRFSWDHDDLFVNNTIYFGDLLKLEAPVRIYEEIKDKQKLNKILVNQLEDYNFTFTNKMNLVFFQDAVRK